jgi:CheY-like chemotaxis protein
MPYTLLLADASSTIQRIVELTFASEDIAVVAFSNGEHAIASLDRSVPDIVLADVGMPGRSGYEVSRYIKNSPPLAHIPVLLLTGAFEPVDQARALEAGCDGILIKPFEPKFVISRVKELLRKPKPGSKEEEVEQYFEELDKAFANLATSPTSAPKVEPEAAAETPAEPAADLQRAAEPMTSLSLVPDPTAHVSLAPDPTPTASLAPETSTDLPLLSEATENVLLPQRATGASPEPKPTAAVPIAAQPATDVSVSRTARPSLADAFAALLTAEHSANGRQDAPPSLLSSPRVVINDDVIERVTRRVLEQMSDSVVRQTVTEIVQATTERLVHEEIERIKSNIK